MIDRKTFFDRIRVEPFGGFMSGPQVTGLSNILDEADRRGSGDPRHLAYRLATVFHETGRAMIPVREAGGEAYLKAKPYYPWVGMGLVQVTWNYNGKKFGATKPEDLMSWPVALRALFDGMDEGVFTGRRLSTYFNDKMDDPVGARHIINGSDKAALIAGYHAHFLAALKASGESTLSIVAVDGTKPVLAGIERAINAAGAVQSREALVKPTAPSLPIGGSMSTTISCPAPIAASSSVPTAPPAHIDAAKPAPRPSFWAGLVAAFTPKPKTEA